MIRRISKLHRVLIVTCLSMITSIGYSQKDSDVLFSVAGDDVTVSEFRYIYEKNNRDEADYSKKNLKEYLDLYTNFKLKVARAKELGLHNDENYQRELNGYRKKLADSYILDREVNERLVDQILERKKHDVQVSHILMMVNRKAPKQLHDAALGGLDKAIKAIKGGMSFEEAARTFSQDKNSAPSGGDIGYMTGGLPDGYVELEHMMYTTPVGQVSNPIQTNLGYHIIKVTDKRPARGKMEAQHILVRSKKFGKPVAGAEEKVRQIYKKLQQHPENFDMMAESLSEDKRSKKKKGNLGVFGIGEYDAAFEDAAFGLTVDGQLSEPVQSAAGWHIIKRVGRKAPESRERIQTIVKDKMNTGERFDIQKRVLVEEIKKEVGYKKYEKTYKAFKSALDETYLIYRWNPPAMDEEALMRIGDKTYTAGDFIRFNKITAKSRLRDNDGDINTLADRMYDEFVQDKVIEYMEGRLEERYPDFRNLIREYQEGILLFEVSKQEIWDKASKDSLGLAQFFEKNKDKYIWQPRAVIDKYSLRTANAEMVNYIKADAKTMTPEELMGKYNSDKIEMILHERVTVERSSELLKGASFREGGSSTPHIDKSLKASTFVIIKETMPAQRKTISESRGYVISDYQEYLEKNWIKELKSKYPVKIKNRTLKKLYK